MEMVTSLESFLIIGVMLLTLWILTRKPKNFPPGPARWPIFGHIPILIYRGQSNTFISNLHKKYGNVVGLYAFNIPLVFISGRSEIQEALFHDDFSGRPKQMNLNIIGGKPQGMLLTTGEQWKSQRRFTIQHLRDLGFGKSSLEVIIHEEVQGIFEGIEEISGGLDNGYCYPVDFEELIRGANINTLWHLMTGVRYSYKDPKFKQLMEDVHDIFNRNIQEIYLYNLFPCISKMIPRSWGGDYESSHLRIHQFIQEEIDIHKKYIDYDSPRDFMDTYLCEINKQKNEDCDFFTESQLKQLCAEFFIGGSDTTANAMYFAVLYMVLYPEVQKKFQRELDMVVGRDRLPSLKDRSRLPYAEATIQELHRLSSVSPTPFPHSPSTDKEYITFRGYTIPKNSIIVFDLYGLHHDPKIWKYPEMFIPERFLKNNDDINPNEFMCPFGGGKRKCPSESMSRNNIFLFLTAILQRYSLRVPEGHPQPSAEPDGYTILYPKPFTVGVKLRI